MSDGSAVKIQRLGPAHVAAYRALMLEAYAAAPRAFTSTVAEREVLPLAWWAERVSGEPDAPQLVCGALAGGALVGVAGLKFGQRERTRHRATLYGMYVRGGFAGRGLGRRLVAAVLDEAVRRGIHTVRLTVTADNAAALALYAACGFERIGEEPAAVRHGAEHLAKVHMWRTLERP